MVINGHNNVASLKVNSSSLSPVTEARGSTMRKGMSSSDIAELLSLAITAAAKYSTVSRAQPLCSSLFQTCVVGIGRVKHHRLHDHATEWFC